MKLLVPYDITDAVLASSSVAESDHAAWSAVTAYALGARCIRNHRIWERLIPGTTAAAPETDPANWLDVGATNRWAMFDDSPSTRTSAASSITVQLALGAVNDVILMGVAGSTVTITKPGGEQVSQAVPAETIAGEGATVRFAGLGGAAGTYTVALTGTGAVRIGTIALGALTSIGDTAYGVSLGIQDYSTAAFDEYGTLELIRRGYSRRAKFPLTMPIASMSQVMTILAALRAKALFWVGDDGRASTVVYGWFDEASLSKKGQKAVGSISIKGLTTA